MLTHTQRLFNNGTDWLSTIGNQLAPDSTKHTGQYTHCLTGMHHPVGNMVMVGELSDMDFQAHLDKLESWTSQNAAPIALFLISDTETERLGAITAKRNWMQIEKMPGMWLDIPADFEIGPLARGAELMTVNDNDSLQRVIDAVEGSYPLPREVSDFYVRGAQLAGEAEPGMMANFLIMVDGATAACSSVFIKDNVAGINFVATLDQFRRKGLGGAVTRAAIKYAKDRGIEHAILVASELGEPVYRKIGFEECCRIPFYGFGMGE